MSPDDPVRPDLSKSLEHAERRTSRSAMNAPETNVEEPVVAEVARSSFWNRHKTLINFWLDTTLLVLFVLQGWMLTVVQVVFPRGSGDQWTIWGATALDWLDRLFATFCVFSVGVLLHVMLHWSWVCGTVSTRILGRKARKDDGTQTLLGVGLLVVLLHLFAAGVLAARWGLVSRL